MGRCGVAACNSQAKRRVFGFYASFVLFILSKGVNRYPIPSDARAMMYVHCMHPYSCPSSAQSDTQSGHPATIPCPFDINPSEL